MDAPNGEVERTGQIPQDEEEREKRDSRTHGVEAEPQCLVREVAEILLDALVRIVGGALRQFHPIVNAICQPVLLVSRRQPAAPTDVLHLAEVILIDSDNNVGERQDRKYDQLSIEIVQILLLQGIIEARVPVVEQHRQIDLTEVEGDDQRQQEARHPALLRCPVRLRQAPQLAEKTSYARSDQGVGHVIARLILSARMLAIWRVIAIYHIAARCLRDDGNFAGPGLVHARCSRRAVPLVC